MKNQLMCIKENQNIITSSPTVSALSCATILENINHQHLIRYEKSIKCAQKKTKILFVTSSTTVSALPCATILKNIHFF